MDFEFLKIIACPLCHSSLIYYENKQILVCKLDSVFYPIENGIPILLGYKAKSIKFLDLYKK